MWEGGLRVPFVMRWPTKLPAGRITDEFLTSLEIVPTLLAATQTKTPANLFLDGFDMLPVLRGDKESSRTEMFWQRRSDKAARVGSWKWVDSAKGKGLFDLSRDLSESNDLSSDRPDMLKQIQDRFASWQKQMSQAEPRGPFRDY